MLFVANADASNLAVFNVTRPGKAEPLGFIPTGWYPTSVRYNPADHHLYVADGKGLSSRANPQGPSPYNVKKLKPVYQYIASLFQGYLSVIDLPSPEKLAEYTKQAYASSPLRADAGPVGTLPEGGAIPRKAAPVRSSIASTSSRRIAPTIRCWAT